MEKYTKPVMVLEEIEDEVCTDTSMPDYISLAVMVSDTAAGRI